MSRERENRAHRCPQPKEEEKSHEQSVRRVIWLRESNKRIEKRIEKLPPDQGCSGRLQCELQRESEAVRTEYAQTKCKTDRRAACLGKRLFELVHVLARECLSKCV